MPPLCAIARWNKPFATGDPTSARNHVRAGRLAEDRHVCGVAAEARDVSLHPLQRGDRVEHAVVARHVRARDSADELGVSEEAECAEAVVRS